MDVKYTLYGINNIRGEGGKASRREISNIMKVAVNL